MKLTDAVLSELIAAYDNTLHSTPSAESAGAFMETRAALHELRDLRALLSHEMPCGFETPHVVVMRGHGAEDMVEWHGAKYFADDAIGIGAAMIRAALEAKETR